MIPFWVIQFLLTLPMIGIYGLALGFVNDDYDYVYYNGKYVYQVQNKAGVNT